MIRFSIRSMTVIATAFAAVLFAATANAGDIVPPPLRPSRPRKRSRASARTRRAPPTRCEGRVRSEIQLRTVLRWTPAILATSAADKWIRVAIILHSCYLYVSQLLLRGKWRQVVLRAAACVSRVYREGDCVNVSVGAL